MRKLLAMLTIVTLSGAGACAVHDASPPAPTGPSELALSLRMAANPDHVLEDGSQSVTIAVTAFDAGSNPIAVQVRLTGQPAGYGTLSASSIMTTTDASKPATVVYFPPVSTSGTSTTVTIQATMVTSNAVNGATQQVVISAIPAVNLATSAPSASMTASPVSPAQAFALNKPISFDASGSCGTQKVGGVCAGTSAIVSYTWSFGDSTPVASGVTVTHTYTTAGTYSPQVTITNAQGLQASATQSLTLASVSSPTASFVVSPSSVKANTGTETFNGIASSAASGHGIVQYAWNFGDGNTSSGTSATASHVYTAIGTYTATLTVTDDVGQNATTSGTVTVN